MIVVDFLLAIFDAHRNDQAVIWRDEPCCYAQLLARIAFWQNKIHKADVKPGAVAALEADFSFDAIALFLALIEHTCIVVPMAPAALKAQLESIEIAQADVFFCPNAEADMQVFARSCSVPDKLYLELRQSRHPGLVLFSSGSTGAPKAAVHDAFNLLKKYRTPRHNLRTIAFLPFDHIGGIDTLFYALSNGSCLIAVTDRTPDAVCRAVEMHRAEVLPVSPTFLNLLLLSRAYEKYDLTSLRYITYGAEVMPETTLRQCAERFPNVVLRQKYGTTETGVLRSQSRRSDSVWIKMGGEDVQMRVVDGTLHLKTPSTILGYLNAASPFTDDGWFDTGDAVEVDGPYMKIVGRRSEIINVGGEKVHPAEVENVILQMDRVLDATVYGEKNPLVGQIVCAKVRLAGFEDANAFVLRLKKHCMERLQDYKVPVKVVISDDLQHGARVKKMRPGVSEYPPSH